MHLEGKGRRKGGEVLGHTPEREHALGEAAGGEGSWMLHRVSELLSEGLRGRSQ